MILKPCTVCGRLQTGSRCPAHRPRNGSTRAWRQTRAEILYRDAYRCALCGRAASDVDHTVPLSAGGTDHPANLRSLCRACHHDQH